jgi:hypothetical protein
VVAVQTKRRDPFTTIRTEGAILPADLLQRVRGQDPTLGGMKEADYHLAGDERLNEAIVNTWNRLVRRWSDFQAALSKLASTDSATSPTREKWLLPLFGELDYGRLLAAGGPSPHRTPGSTHRYI